MLRSKEIFWMAAKINRILNNSMIITSLWKIIDYSHIQIIKYEISYLLIKWFYFYFTSTTNTSIISYLACKAQAQMKSYCLQSVFWFKDFETLKLYLRLSSLVIRCRWETEIVRSQICENIEWEPHNSWVWH